MRKAIQLAQGKVRVQNILLAIGQDKAGLMTKKTIFIQKSPDWRKHNIGIFCCRYKYHKALRQSQGKWKVSDCWRQSKQRRCKQQIKDLCLSLRSRLKLKKTKILCKDILLHILSCADQTIEGRNIQKIQWIWLLYSETIEIWFKKKTFYRQKKTNTGFFLSPQLWAAAIRQSAVAFEQEGKWRKTGIHNKQTMNNKNDKRGAFSNSFTVALWTCKVSF